MQKQQLLKCSLGKFFLKMKEENFQNCQTRKFLFRWSKCSNFWAVSVNLLPQKICGLIKDALIERWMFSGSRLSRHFDDFKRFSFNFQCNSFTVQQREINANFAKYVHVCMKQIGGLWNGCKRVKLQLRYKTGYYFVTVHSAGGRFNILNSEKPDDVSLMPSRWRHWFPQNFVVASPTCGSCGRRCLPPEGAFLAPDILRSLLFLSMTFSLANLNPRFFYHARFWASTCKREDCELWGTRNKFQEQINRVV